MKPSHFSVRRKGGERERERKREREEIYSFCITHKKKGTRSHFSDLPTAERAACHVARDEREDEKVAPEDEPWDEENIPELVQDF